MLAGQVPQARLDDMVRRILTSMFRVGLFDHPTPDPATTRDAVVTRRATSGWRRSCRRTAPCC